MSREHTHTQACKNNKNIKIIRRREGKTKPKIYDGIQE